MYFIDRTQIDRTVDHMEELLALYKEEDHWEEGITHQLALARLTHVLIESIIDVGNSMIDGFIMRDPGGYDDIIDILEDEKVITPEMSDPLKEVIALRKMIVREFIQVDSAQVVAVLNKSLTELEAFAPKVRHYIEHELGPVSAFMPVEDDEK